MDPAEELLAQIADLMGQYIALGGDTPLADSMPGMLEEIQAVAGGGEQLPAAGGDPAAALPGMPPPGGEGAPTFEGAEQAALADYQGGRFDSAEGEELPEEEEDPKKRLRAR